MGELDALETLARGLGGPVAGQIRAALEHCRAPVTVQVAGRAGVGRRSVAAALGLPPDTVTTTIDAVDHPDPVLDADVVVYVVAGGRHPTDRASCERTLLVRNKADLSDSRDGGHLMVATLALATARQEVTLSDLERFRALARSTDATLLAAEPLFRGAEADVDLDERVELLHRWGFAGIACAVTSLRRNPGLDAARLHRILRSASGVDTVAVELGNRVDAALARRRVVLHADLVAIVARAGCEQVERFVESGTGGYVCPR